MTVEQSKPIEVSAQMLSPEALYGVIESFILREGTDYGAVEISFEKKIEQIRRQIDNGDIKIFYDPALESITLMNAPAGATYKSIDDL